MPQRAAQDKTEIEKNLKNRFFRLPLLDFGRRGCWNLRPFRLQRLFGDANLDAARRAQSDAEFRFGRPEPVLGLISTRRLLWAQDAISEGSSSWAHVAHSGEGNKYGCIRTRTYYRSLSNCIFYHCALHNLFNVTNLISWSICTISVITI